jgi:hypothetical protein
MIFVVAYSLREPNTAADYARIIEAIKAYGTWCRLEDSVWMIESDQNYEQVRDRLMGFIRPADAILVIEATAAAWSGSLDEERRKWIRGLKWPR